MTCTESEQLISITGEERFFRWRPVTADTQQRVGSEVSRSEPERPEAERSAGAGPEPTQPNWIQTNLATKRRDQTGGLIES